MKHLRRTVNLTIDVTEQPDGTYVAEVWSSRLVDLSEARHVSPFGALDDALDQWVTVQTIAGQMADQMLGRRSSSSTVRSDDPPARPLTDEEREPPYRVKEKT